MALPAVPVERPPKTTRAVIILGAGSSADFGVPTLAGVFKDVFARQYLLKQRTDLLDMLRATFWHPRGHDLDTSDQSLTIEEMLTALRDWESEKGLPEGRRPAATEQFLRRLNVLVYKAVFEGKSSRPGHLNPLLEVARQHFAQTTWASFNWDCMFEASFYYSSGGRGLFERANPYLRVDIANWYQGYTSQELLKLHGSISWWLVDGRLTYLQWGGGVLERKWAEYDARDDHPDMPVILEPSFYKYGGHRYSLLLPQWEVFFQRLLEADLVIIVGYSLPDGDQQARSKILAAFHANQRARWLIVDPGVAACARYERLLGKVRVATLPMTLAGMNAQIIPHLRQAFPDTDFD